jgi:hypothetical protein
VSVHEGLSLSLSVLEVGHAFDSFLTELKQLFQPVLLGLSLGKSCRDLYSEAGYLEFNRHHGF